jgi:hypothetical protein
LERHRQDPARDHEIQRHEQVGGVAAGLERDAEGKGGDDRQGEQDRPAAEGAGEGSGGRHGYSGEDDQLAGAVAQVGDLVRVPLVAEDEDGEEDEGREHRGGAQASGGSQDRPGCAERGDDHAHSREQLAHEPFPFA